ncbi:MAG: bifunctional pyr operon transcriptional regulator/uracil phosphoribosyltransferase PyrR [Acidobacteriaceae bacterium]
MAREGADYVRVGDRAHPGSPGASDHREKQRRGDHRPGRHQAARCPHCRAPRRVDPRHREAPRRHTRDVRPVVVPGSLGFDVNGRDVILIDDVLYTGRTIRAALDALFDHGRPRRVQLLVLIDRGHRELPIEATFVGRAVPTSQREIIEVKLKEVDNDEQVLLVERVE